MAKGLWVKVPPFHPYPWPFKKNHPSSLLHLGYTLEGGAKTQHPPSRWRVSAHLTGMRWKTNHPVCHQKIERNLSSKRLSLWKHFLTCSEDSWGGIMYIILHTTWDTLHTIFPKLFLYAVWLILWWYTKHYQALHTTWHNTIITDKSAISSPTSTGSPQTCKSSEVTSLHNSLPHMHMQAIPARPAGFP